MLERTDRLALAVKDADAASKSFSEIFDSVVVNDIKDPVTKARRVTLQWGQDQIELYEPTGSGPAANFIDQGRSGIFAGGFSTPDPSQFAADLQEKDITVHELGNDQYIVLPDDLSGTGVIISKTESRARVGLNDKIWQITYAMPDLKKDVDKYSALFGLEKTFTNFYKSDLYGYDGAITWFDARKDGLLDSLEYLEPTDPSAAVARFVKRNGTGIYMASIETDQIPAIKERVTSTGKGWSGTDYGGFIHPKRLHGLLIGLVTYKDWNTRRPLPEKD